MIRSALVASTSRGAVHRDADGQPTGLQLQLPEPTGAMEANAIATSFGASSSGSA